MTYHATITLDLPWEDEADVQVDWECTPYDPGVCSGPVEACYPPEGGEVSDVVAIYRPFPSAAPIDVTGHVLASERAMERLAIEAGEWDCDIYGEDR